MVFCFSASMIYAFPCFSCLAASLLFLLLCFSVFAVPASSLLCFPWSSAFVFLCLSTSIILLILLFSHLFLLLLGFLVFSGPLLLYFCTFLFLFFYFFASVICFCCSTSFLSLLSFCFSCAFVLFCPVCFLSETLKKAQVLGETQRNPKEFMIRNPDKKTDTKPYINPKETIY